MQEFEKKFEKGFKKKNSKVTIFQESDFKKTNKPIYGL